jgi:hypothetical protein
MRPLEGTAFGNARPELGSQWVADRVRKDDRRPCGRPRELQEARKAECLGVGGNVVGDSALEGRLRVLLGIGPEGDDLVEGIARDLYPKAPTALDPDGEDSAHEVP